MKTYEYRLLIEELKILLKSREMTYKDLARELKMSEAGVKRIFSSQDGKLSTLARICEALGFKFLDLASSTKMNQKRISYFTPEQDYYLSTNFQVYIFFNELVIRQKSLETIAVEHDLSEKMVENLLRRLEKIELIRRTSKGDIKCMLSPPIGIKQGGELRKVLQEKFVLSLGPLMFDPKIPAAERELTTREWLMSRESCQKFCSELSELVRRYDQITSRESAVVAKDDLVSHSLATLLLKQVSPYGKILNQN